MALPTVFVCGVTGTQGGTVARHLLFAGARVHALVRRPAESKAQELQSLGAQIWPGDFDDSAALRQAMIGCTAAFLNFMPDFTDFGAELRWARSLLSVAREAGVQHVVYSSGIGSDAPEKNPYWDPNGFVAAVQLSKKAIEKEVCESGFPFWTILRQGFFMSNFLQPLVSTLIPAFVETGVWTTPLTKETGLPLVDTESIGRFSCAVFLDPVRFHGRGIEYVDEILTPDQIITKLSTATGRGMRVVYLSDEEIEAQKATNPFVSGQIHQRAIAAYVDMTSLGSWGVAASTFDAFLKREKSRVAETYARAAEIVA
ncbi:hypothetical protein HK405_004858 [Cladochytrium tenue]|nr:hypothetical protein HK405_004858 [Cladochytrium tenue]